MRPKETPHRVRGGGHSIVKHPVFNNLNLTDLIIWRILFNKMFFDLNFHKERIDMASERIPVPVTLKEKLLHYGEILDDDDEDTIEARKFIELINIRREKGCTIKEIQDMSCLISSIERQIKEGDLIFEYAERLRQKGISPLSREADSEKMSILLESVGSPDPEILSDFNKTLDVARLLMELGRRKKQEEGKNEKAQGQSRGD